MEEMHPIRDKPPEVKNEEKTEVKPEVKAEIKPEVKNTSPDMENSVDCVTKSPNSPDRDFPQKSNLINENLCKRKDAIKNWLKDPYNLAFLGIFIFAIALRLYYFSLTKNQPIWWDESDYLAYAKYLAGFPVSWTITGPHSSIFPYFVAFFFKLGFSEAVAKFFLEIIPSILVVFLIYRICILMYKDKRIALISSFLSAVLWEFLFDSMRFHLEMSAILFGFLAVYIFWEGYERKQKIFGKLNPNWAVPLAVFFVLLTYSARRGYFFFGAFFLVYMFFTRSFKELIKDKYNWIGLLIAIGMFLFAETFIFVSPIAEASKIYARTDVPLTLTPFLVFHAFFDNIYNSNLSILFYLFWLGLILLAIGLFFNMGYFKKKTNWEANSDLFAFISIAVIMCYFLFFQRRIDGDFGEPRWYFPLLLGAFVSISKGTILIADYLKKYSRYIPVIIIALLIGYGGYYQVAHADFIIKNKLPSFEGIRQASFYIKEISNPQDVIVSVAGPQVIYYAERKILQPDKMAGWPDSQVPFENFMDSLKNTTEAKYLFVSFSQTGHPAWMQKMSGNANGQIAAWEIPFMDTKIDFSTNTQDIKQSKTYDNITFVLLQIKQDVFIYEIQRK